MENFNKNNKNKIMQKSKGENGERWVVRKIESFKWEDILEFKYNREKI